MPNTYYDEAMNSYDSWTTEQKKIWNDLINGDGGWVKNEAWDNKSPANYVKRTYNSAILGIGDVVDSVAEKVTNIAGAGKNLFFLIALGAILLLLFKGDIIKFLKK